MNNNFSNWLSSGNRWKDALIGGVTGFGQAFQQPGKYYVQANWAGNGLARTGLGYMANPNYRDYFSGGRALSALGNLNKNIEQTEQENSNNSLENILGRLSMLKGNLGTWSANALGKLNKDKYGERGNFDYPIV